MHFQSACRAALVSIAVATFAAGCGGTGQAETSGGPPSLSESRLIAKAEAICAGGDRAYAKVEAKFRHAKKALNVEYANALTEISERIAERLAALEPPPGMRSAYRRYAQAEERVHWDDYVALHAAHSVHAHEFTVALRRRARDQGKARTLARQLGIGRCSAVV
jgi:hypothetical protein